MPSANALISPFGVSTRQMWPPHSVARQWASNRVAEGTGSGSSANGSAQSAMSTSSTIRPCPSTSATVRIPSLSRENVRNVVSAALYGSAPSGAGGSRWQGSDVVPNNSTPVLIRRFS